MDRRVFLASSAAGMVGAVGVAGALAGASQPGESAAGASASAPLKGRLKQSVCRWCFSGVPLEKLCDEAKAIGLRSVELLGPDEWSVAIDRGLTCAVASPLRSNPIGKGLNRLEHHDAILRELEERLPKVAKAGIPNQIVFSGNRAGLSDEEGLEHCAAGLRRMVPMAEAHGVTLIMELLNSKVDHKDYQCDRTPWGVKLCEMVGSPRFGLLYDIYHMQIMEGDIIRTIRDHHRHIRHYHTAGVPGRREFDQTQELQYPAICRAIVETGYEGYLGQEFIPSGDSPLASLRAMAALCDV
jgi:hydroxypyruvate isomerase